MTKPSRWWVSFPHQYGGPKLHRMACRYAGPLRAPNTGSVGCASFYPVRFLRLSGTIYRVEPCKLCDPKTETTPDPSPEQLTLEFP